jgi:hypothetical protein
MTFQASSVYQKSLISELERGGFTLDFINEVQRFDSEQKASLESFQEDIARVRCLLALSGGI